MVAPDTTRMSLEEYQMFMDTLALNISKVMQGVRVEDGMSACAACIGFGMLQLPSDQHGKMREHLNRIIDTIIEKAPRQKQ
jgi:hypothetical protein